MALEGALRAGDVAVLDAQTLFLASVAAADTWAGAIAGLTERLAEHLDALPHVDNWVLVVRYPYATKLQRWRDALGALDCGYTLWKDDVCAQILEEEANARQPPLGGTPLGHMLQFLTTHDIGGIQTLQGSSEYDRMVDMRALEAISPLPAHALRGAWMANPFILANLLLPFLGRLGQSRQFLMGVQRRLKTPRPLTVVLDAAYLPVDRSYEGRDTLDLDTDAHLLVIRSGGVAGVPDTIDMLPTSTLADLAPALRSSPDPLARGAAWALAVPMYLNRTAHLWFANRTPLYVALVVLENLMLTFNESSEPQTYGELTLHEPPFLQELTAGHTRLFYIGPTTPPSKVGPVHAVGAVDVGILCHALFASHKRPGTSAAYALVASGLLLRDAGIPQMVPGKKHRVLRGPDDVHLFVPHARADGPLSLGVRGLPRLLEALGLGSSQHTDAEVAERRVAVSDYVRACHNAYLLNHYTGEVYAAFARLDTLAGARPADDTFGFATWLAAARRLGSYAVHGSSLPAAAVARRAHASEWAQDARDSLDRAVEKMADLGRRMRKEAGKAGALAASDLAKERARREKLEQAKAMEKALKKAEEERLEMKKRVKEAARLDREERRQAELVKETDRARQRV
jgi:hypothetical protein